MNLRSASLSAVAAAMLAAAVPNGAQAAVEAGGLNCRSPGGVGFILGAVLNFDCIFSPTSGGPPQHYVATVRRVGVDLGFTQGVTMGWVVFAPTGILHPGDLAGNYGGVDASATFGVGVGANALVGGSNNSIALQPLSAQTQTGLNVAAGFTGLELRTALAYEPAPLRHYGYHHVHQHHHHHHVH
jgi:hypothetical protein